MFISIVIPIFKSQVTLAACIDSFLEQSFNGKLEILCIGDRVEDPCHVVAMEYANRYPGIVSFHLQDGRGQGGARNLGLDLARGEFVIFADADDRAGGDMIASCLAAQQESDADLVCCGFDRADASGHVYSRERMVTRKESVVVTPENIARLAYVYPAPWGKLFRRSVIGDCRFPENPLSAYEDLIFFLAVCRRITRYVLLPDIHWHYLVNAGSTVTRATLEKTSVFRSDLAALKEQYAGDARCGSLLDLAAFIHVGVADVHRMAENPDVPLRRFIADAKGYLDCVFPGWRRIGLRQYDEFSVRCSAVYVFTWLYRCNAFILFIRFYNFMIKHLRIDVKW